MQTAILNFDRHKAFARVKRFLAVSFLGALAASSYGQSTVPMPSPLSRTPPKTWIEADTGHRITRLTDELNSQALYFDINAYTPDGRDMIYRGPGGIYDLNLSTLTTQLIAPGKLANIVVGTRTRRVFFQNYIDGRCYVVDIDTKLVTQLPSLPLRGQISSVNADETLLAGTKLEGMSLDFLHYKLKAIAAVNQSIVAAHQDLVAANLAALGSPSKAGPDPNYNGAAALASAKAEVKENEDATAEAFLKANADAVEQRFSAQSTEDMFTMDIQTGKVTTILRGQDWLNHVQFSPTDPNLILYAHEGPSQKVDRVWTVRIDGSQNQLRHRRTDPSGIATHEFWGRDGKTIWFDLQESKGEDFAVAGIDVASGNRTVYRLSKAEASLHYNVSADGTLFCGDGNLMAHGALGARGHKTLDRKWIELLQPQPDGTLHATRLAHITANDYARSEPDVRFTPDNSMVIFTSNMLGPTYVFGVEVAKAAANGPAGE